MPMWAEPRGGTVGADSSAVAAVGEGEGREQDGAGGPERAYTDEPGSGHRHDASPNGRGANPECDPQHVVGMPRNGLVEKLPTSTTAGGRTAALPLVYACEILMELRRRRHLAPDVQNRKPRQGHTCTKT